MRRGSARGWQTVFVLPFVDRRRYAGIVRVVAAVATSGAGTASRRDVMQSGVPSQMSDIHLDQDGRALADHQAAPVGELRTGAVGRFRGGLARLRRLAPQRPDAIYGTRVLTGKACRLADGSIGQVALHESDGEWVEVCVQP